MIRTKALLHHKDMLVRRESSLRKNSTLFVREFSMGCRSRGKGRKWNLEGMVGMGIPFVSSWRSLSGCCKQVVFVAFFPSNCVFKLRDAEFYNRTSWMS